MSIETLVKDPASILDYTVDWTQWLVGTDTISASVWTLPAGITQVSTSFTGTTATIRLSGGNDGTDYDVANQVTLTSGQKDQRTITIEVRVADIAWTYSKKPSTSAKDKVRFLCQDTDRKDQLVLDEEITFALAETGQNIYLAASHVCRAIAAQFTREVSFLDTRGASLDSDKQAERYLRLADLYQKRAIMSGAAAVFAGGLTITDKSTREDDTDRVPPAFTRELHRRPGTPTIPEDSADLNSIFLR